MIGVDTRIVGLDVLRGFAAIAVAYYHCVALLNLHAWSDLPGFVKYLYIAVPLFFAISAFSLCAGYVGRLNGSADIRRFYLRRFLRIAPLFYVMLVLSVARRAYVGWGTPTLTDVVLNLTFLFPFVPGKHESLVPAGWSLGIEILFYVLFPMALVLIMSLRRALIAMGVATVLSFVASYWLHGMNWSPSFYWMALPVQFAFFLGGMLLYALFCRLSEASIKGRKRTGAAILTVTILGLYVGGSLGLFEWVYDGWPVGRLLVGFTLLPLVLGFALYSVPILVNQATIYLGQISYGVYLIHPFVIRVIGEPLQKALTAAGLSAWQSSSIIVGTVLTATFFFAAVSYRWLERPFMGLVRVRREATTAREATQTL